MYKKQCFSFLSLSPLLYLAYSHLLCRSQFTVTVSEMQSLHPPSPHYPLVLIKIPWCLQNFVIDCHLPICCLWTQSSTGAGIRLIGFTSVYPRISVRPDA